MLRRSYPALLLALLLAGCATTTSPAKPVTEASQEEVHQDDAWRKEDLPAIELTPQILYQQLISDVALQRGQPELAAAGWFDLAKQTRDPRIARRALELAIATGQSQQAQESVKIWAESAPKSSSARMLRMSLLIRGNLLQDAEALIPDLLTLPQSELASFYMQLHLLWDRKAESASVEKLTQALTEGKETMPEAHFARAVMQASQDHFPVALTELDQALRLRPEWDQAILYKAQLLSQQGHFDQAVTLLQQASRKTPDQVNYLLALARTLSEAKRLDEARLAYSQALKLQPDLFEATLGSGLLAMQAKDWDNAYQLLLAASQRASRNVDSLRYYLAEIEEERGHQKEAIDWYRQIQGGEKARARQRIPILLAKLGQRDEAIKALTDIPANTPAEKADKIQVEAQMWRNLKDIAKARKVLDLAITQLPDAIDLYYDRSLIAEQQGDLGVAEADLRFILSKQADNAATLNALGYILANRTERLNEAQSLLQQALAKEPNNPTIIDSMGWLRFRQGQFKEAAELLAKAYQLFPDPEIAAHYAETLWRLEDKTRARSILDSAFKTAPENDTVINTRKRLGL